MNFSCCTLDYVNSTDNSNRTFGFSADSDIYRTSSLIFSLIMLCFCITGTIGNFLSALIFGHHSMRTSINVLLCGLSCTDMALLLLALPAFVLPALNAYLRAELLSQIQAATFVGYPLACVAQTCSIWTFLLITLERFVAVKLPFLARDLCTVKRSVHALLLTLLVSICFNVVRFWEYTLEFDGTSYVMQENLRLNSTYTRLYHMCFLLTHFVIPFALLLVLNCWTMHTIHVASRQREQISSQQNHNYRVTWMLIFIIFLFLVCNTPLFLVNLADASVRDLFTNLETSTKAYMAVDISNSLVLLNSTVTCLIYYCCSQKYRVLLFHLFARFCYWSRLRTDQDNKAFSFLRAFGTAMVLNTETTLVRRPSGTATHEERSPWILRNGYSHSHSLRSQNGLNLPAAARAQHAQVEMQQLWLQSNNNNNSSNEKNSTSRKPSRNTEEDNGLATTTMLLD